MGCSLGKGFLLQLIALASGPVDWGRYRDTSAEELAALVEAKRARQRSRPVTPCPHGACWVEPELDCRVQGQGWTSHGRLRHGVFRGLLE